MRAAQRVAVATLSIGATCIATGSRVSASEPAEGASCRADTLALEGFSRVRETVVQALLPRAVPAMLSTAEVSELERRLWTMAIFDDVEVSCRASTLRVRVREKWTLVPSVDFATSRTLRDSYFFVLLAESNFLGYAQELGAYGAYAERAFSGEVWWAEQQAFARRASLEAGLAYVGAGLFFADSAYTWERRRAAARFAVRLPFRYGTRWRFALGGTAYRETLDGELPGAGSDEATQPVARRLSDGFGGSTVFRATWDSFKWNDVAPEGMRFSTEISPGVIARERGLAPRHNVLVQLTGAVPLFKQGVLVWNSVLEGGSPGDPNHASLLGNVANWRFSLGSLGGVRGLPDNLYRNAFQVYGNLELRAALTLAPRWYLQGVTFVDAGSFAPMDAFGRVQDARTAVSVGAGLRLLPTAIASLVPRIDAGRALATDPRWFITFGLSQYL
jgi:hypothetical protein